jgi:hypothetical protein
LITTKKIANLAPCGQPTSVHEIADRLFPAYEVDGGRAYLAGCTLDDRLFLQATLRLPNGSNCFFLDSAGRRLDEASVKKLGLDNTRKLEKPPQPAQAEIARLAEIARRMAEEQLGEKLDGNTDGRPQLELAALWCKYAAGKLRFMIGDRPADLPFSDWAATLVPPPYVCRYTGQETFHLAATSDGRIVAADKIETCEASGQRLLDVDMATCSASGQHVSRELTEVCPVTDEHVLADKMVKCASCGEMVSPNGIRADRCSACRRMEKLAKDDQRWARLLDVYPGIARHTTWGRSWKISETASSFILKGGIFKRILLVLDKDTLEPKRLAVGNRFSPAWKAAEVSRIGEVL